MTVRNIKVRGRIILFFDPLRNRPQEIQHNIRALRRLSGYLPEKHNRDELMAIADWLEDIRDHCVVPLHDLINSQEGS